MNAVPWPLASDRLWRWAIGLGGLVLATAVWCPWYEVTLSFSGPTRVVAHYGLLTPWETTTLYSPRRIGNSTLLATEPPREDETVWDYLGELDQDTIVVKVQERTASVHYMALTGSIAASLGLVWLTVLRPGKKRPETK